MLEPLVPSELVQKMRKITPVLGRGVVWSAMAVRGHLSASVASSVAALSTLVMVDHVGANAWAASVVRFSTAVGDFLFPSVTSTLSFDINVHN